jgi:hypothetical protein
VSPHLCLDCQYLAAVPSGRPLNFLALRSMRWIVKRWEKIGGSDPGQYILPHHARRTPQQKEDPSHTGAGPLFTEPMGQIYRAARAILKDAGLAHLDPYDMRSHAITKLLSDPNVSDQMYTEIVGHVGAAMKRRYSKQRMENKRGAMDAMCKTQVELCELEVESEVEARTQTVIPKLGDLFWRFTHLIAGWKHIVRPDAQRAVILALQLVELPTGEWIRHARWDA